MSKSRSKVTQIVYDAIAPVVKGLGFDIWDIEYKKIGADYHLIVTIDSAKEEGVDIDDCELVHRAIDPVLDETDPIEDSYYLDVSSPGIERTLRTKEHFSACNGEKILIKLFSLQNGKKEFSGVLEYDTEMSSVTIVGDDGEKNTFAFDDIAKANVCFDI